MDASPFDVNTVLGAALAYLVMASLRWLGRTRFWRRIAEGASRVLHDPGIPVDDPRQAAERALVEAQSDKLDEVARKIANGHSSKE